MYWLFHRYKNKQKLVTDCTRKQDYENLFFFCILTTVVTVSCGSTLPVFAFVSAKIPSSLLRDLAFLTRYLETSNSFIVFSIVQLSGVKINSLTFSFQDDTKSVSFISPTNLCKLLQFKLSTQVSACNSSAEISNACETFSSISTLMCFNLFLLAGNSAFRAFYQVLNSIFEQFQY